MRVPSEAASPWDQCAEGLAVRPIASGVRRHDGRIPDRTTDGSGPVLVEDGASLSGSEQKSCTGLPVQLKQATAEAHKRLDRMIIEWEPFASLSRYSEFLRLHDHARRRVVETFGGFAPHDDWARRAATVQRGLCRDLRSLGSRGTPATTSTTWSANSGLGVLYVLEGSLLGGQRLAALVARTLGPHAPRSFLSSGASPNNRWQLALAMLSSHRGDTGPVVAAAVTTFDVYLSTFGRVI